MSNDTDRKSRITDRRIVVDTLTNTLGHVMAEYGDTVYLRPLYGGPEWNLPADRVRPATEAEVQDAK